MDKFGSSLVAIFAAIITLAIISVVISKRSRAPEAISALSNGLARVVAAAVDPKYALDNGDNNSAFTAIAQESGYSLPRSWATVTH